MTLRLAILAVSYLLGSIPFGYLLVRIFRKEDIRATGSGNIGATNVARSGAKGLGLLTLLLDLAKGFAAVMLARHLAPGSPGQPSEVAFLAAVAAVVGHVYPVWLRFRGGKGVATALGVFLALAPFVVLAAVGVFALVLLATRTVSLASVVGAASLMLFAVLFSYSSRFSALSPPHSAAYLGSVVFIALLVIAKHHANLRRLLEGSEPRFGSPRGAVPERIATAPEKKVRI